MLLHFWLHARARKMQEKGASASDNRGTRSLLRCQPPGSILILTRREMSLEAGEPGPTRRHDAQLMPNVASVTTQAPDCHFSVSSSPDVNLMVMVDSFPATIGNT